MKFRKSHTRGFTLLEILLVVGIIAILAGIVILAINPTKQLGDARNAQRRSDVLTILNAVYQYAIDHNGNISNIQNNGHSLDEGIPEDCNPWNGTDALLLSNKLIGTNLTYLTAIPTDPSAVDKEIESEYYVFSDPATKRITVCAPRSKGDGSIPDDGQQIYVTR
jgi:type IV pilus assembly protein PilA